MPKRKPEPDEAKHQAVEEIAGLVDAFCREHLNDEYAELCRRHPIYEVIGQIGMPGGDSRRHVIENRLQVCACALQIAAEATLRELL